MSQRRVDDFSAEEEEEEEEEEESDIWTRLAGV